MAGFVFFATQGNDRVVPEMSAAIERLAPEGFREIQGECSGPAGKIAWHHGEVAPFEHYDGEAGTVLLWGDAIAYDNDSYLTAAEVHRLIAGQATTEGEEALSRYSGLFAWIFLSRDGCLIAGVDSFGFFPLYYFQEGEAFGIATSLTALRQHPEYCSDVDPVGLLRYAIQNGSTGTRTLEHSGRRLATACSIKYDSQNKRFDLNKHRLPGPRAGKKTQPEEKAILQSVEATRRAVERHVQRPPDHALLSGGLDSRHMLALAHEAGIRPLCGTGGIKSDYESMFASSVAKRLGLEWCCQEDSVEALEEGIRNELRLHWLGGGFSTVSLNAGAALSRRLGKRSLGGLVLDFHYSPTGSLRVGRNLNKFDFALKTWINQAGIDPQTLRRMCVDSSMRDALELAMGEIREEWDAFEGTGFDRTWKMLMHFRARPHLGTHAWKQSFYTWPVLPSVDLPMAESIRNIADRHFINRKLQRLTLQRIAPELARIPLATFSHSPEPITPNIAATLQRKYLILRARMKGSRRDEYHRFHRAMNLDQPAWRKVREYAESHRESLHQFFDSDKLDTYLPKPSVTTSIKAGGGHRFICGMMLWNGVRAEQ
ncbi:MAG: hypothetical protein CMK36_06075 [Porticoccaceae bacterium]|nr:hypothetical protein [Porticoccaceae bacterium]